MSIGSMKTERLTLARAVAQMTPRRLEKWLSSRPRVVKFRKGDPCGCVIAGYLSGTCDSVTMFDGGYAIDRDAQYVSVRTWVRNYVSNFDADPRGLMGPRAALRILRECCPQLKGEHATN